MLTKVSWQGVELFEIEQSQEVHLCKKKWCGLLSDYYLQWQLNCKIDKVKRSFDADELLSTLEV